MSKKLQSEGGKKYDFAVGSDHAGFSLKEKLKEHLCGEGKTCVDVGIHKLRSVGTGPIAEKVGRLVAKGKCKKGILVCGTGIGMAMGANKVFGIRAALCHNQFTASYAKRHNDANVICLGARVIAEELALECVRTWLKEKFLGGKYARRLAYLDVIENRSCRIKKPKRENQ
jgi:ribose 5-phosphate isomerase B